MVGLGSRWEQREHIVSGSPGRRGLQGWWLQARFSGDLKDKERGECPIRWRLS